MIFEELIEQVQARFSQEDLNLIEQAGAFAKKYFADLIHPLGQPYLQYAFGLAKLLADLGSGPDLITVALIYPPPPVTRTVLNELEKVFKQKQELLELVKEVLHLRDLEWDLWARVQKASILRGRRELLQKKFLLAVDETTGGYLEQPLLARRIVPLYEDEQAEDLIKRFLAETIDIRALIIKLADRLLFMKLLKYVREDQKEVLHYRELAQITLAVYAPLASRLGMWRLKSELDDMSFRLIEPVKYQEIARQIAAKKQEREIYIARIISAIGKKLKEYGVEQIEISGRAKHIYSIYQKMEVKQMGFEQINDLLGIRIIVHTIEECYKVQVILHTFWKPLTIFYDGQVGRDWIAHPKENLYQSLHTTIDFENKAVEIQIRTNRMHEIAEYGAAAAYWRYKEII